MRNPIKNISMARRQERLHRRMKRNLYWPVNLKIAVPPVVITDLDRQ